ncbi:MAG: AAA family ATPase, partial [Woeseiaceae bacterium]
MAVDFESDTLVAEAGQFEPNSAGLRYLHEMTSRQGRMSVILGPPNSGKTEVIKRFAKNLSGDRVCKVLNARLLTPESLIAACLQSMQYGASRLSSDEMLDLLRVVVSQQARGKKAPILIVDDMQDMTPLAQQTLCSLAGFTNQRHPAIHIVLAGEPGCARLLASPAMAALAARATEVFHLEPLSPTEVRHYLHGRLRASGVRLPDTVFPLDVCESLHEQSGGWLGS